MSIYYPLNMRRDRFGLLIPKYRYKMTKHTVTLRQDQESFLSHEASAANASFSEAWQAAVDLAMQKMETAGCERKLHTM